MSASNSLPYVPHAQGTKTLKSTSILLYPTRLPEHDIRLLTILPSDEFDALIKTELHQYAASCAPAYEGLSYVWGDPRYQLEIRCHNLAVHVTINLRNALRRIRSTSQPKIIWADALCLNQNDIQEKNIHVPLMGRVYSEATNTIIFLSEASDEEADAVKSGLTAISGVIERLATGPPKSDVWEAVALEVSKASREGIAWDAIHRFFGLTWFTRIWCVQEVKLARNSGLDSCAIFGYERILYRHIRSITSTLVVAKDYYPDILHGIYLNACVVAPYTLDVGKVSLLTVLNDFRNLDATDPRDKIYGLLGILHRKFGLDYISVKVDYTKPVMKVYEDVALEILRGMQNLTLLEHVIYPPDFEFLRLSPSWVPRWNVPLLNHSFLEEQKHRFLVSSAVGFTDRQLPLTIDGQRLRVFGLQYGCAVWVSLPLVYLDLVNGASVWRIRNLETAISSWSRQIGLVLLQGMERHRHWYTMARTLTTGRVEAHRNFDAASQERKDQFLADALYFFLTVLDLKSTDEAEVPVLREDGELSPGNKCAGNPERYLNVARTWCHGRTLFLTGHGTYGIGPACMRERDVIVALFGSNSPYALRPTDGGFICLGPGSTDCELGNRRLSLQTAWGDSDSPLRLPRHFPASTS